ncbi:annexin D3-like [Typha angustifolia]|uniref:annexin D3-like n=1 Tax=Typha angustifolia TaxID=59011 RepID=UPI003C2AAE4A
MCLCCCFECLPNVPPFNLILHQFSHSLTPQQEETEEREAMASILVPNPIPSPTEDAQTIREAVQGLGTDEKALIQVLGRRTASQRAEIARSYERLYNESLIDRLYSELSGDFGKAMVLWAMDPAARDAKLAHEALHNDGDRRPSVVVEVACASSPDHLIAVRKAYCSLFSSSIEEEIASCSAYEEPLKQFLVRLVSSYRYVGENVDDNLARSEAAELCDAIRKKQPLNDEVIRIISSRNKSQLKATFQHYKQDHGKSIDEDIEKHSSRKLSGVLKVAVWCLVSPEKHFAEVVRSSIQGFGTDEDSLTRAIVCRAEIDMNKIKEEYKIRYKTTLTRDVIGDTSGDYKDILLTLVGNEVP